MFKSIIYRLINKVETFMLMLHVLQGESLVQESRDKALKPKPSPEGAERSLTSLVYHSSPLVVASGNILQGRLLVVSQLAQHLTLQQVSQGCPGVSLTPMLKMVFVGL